jgi:hypothetical protein
LRLFVLFQHAGNHSISLKLVFFFH